MDGLFLNQKTNKSIRISYSLKYKYKKKKVLYEKINDCVVRNKHSEIKIPESSISEKPSSTMSVMLCTRATFLKKNSCFSC